MDKERPYTIAQKIGIGVAAALGILGIYVALRPSTSSAAQTPTGPPPNNPPFHIPPPGVVFPTAVHPPGGGTLHLNHEVIAPPFFYLADSAGTAFAPILPTMTGATSSHATTQDLADALTAAPSMIPSGTKTLLVLTGTDDPPSGTTQADYAKAINDIENVALNVPVRTIYVLPSTAPPELVAALGGSAEYIQMPPNEDQSFDLLLVTIGAVAASP